MASITKIYPATPDKAWAFPATQSNDARADNEEKFVYVIRTEEKGTDVNLAVNLLNDMWLDKYDCAVIISNDSDLAEAMCLVRKHSEKILILIPPFPPQKNGQYQEN